VSWGKKLKMKGGISKNKMPTPVGVSFFEMPHMILWYITLPLNTLSKILEVFLKGKFSWPQRGF
jgi:hypothetical protein